MKANPTSVICSTVCETRDEPPSYPFKLEFCRRRVRFPHGQCRTLLHSVRNFLSPGRLVLGAHYIELSRPGTSETVKGSVVRLHLPVHDRLEVYSRPGVCGSVAGRGRQLVTIGPIIDSFSFLEGSEVYDLASETQGVNS